MQKKTKRADGRYKGTVFLGISDGRKMYKYVYARSQKELDVKLKEVYPSSERSRCDSSA